MRVEPSNLKQYLPNYYDDVLETDVLVGVENNLFDTLKNHMKNVLDNQFVLTCDVQMLYRYEQMLNIRPDTVLETIEFRRMRVINRLSSRQPFTYWFYRQALDTLFGRDNSTLIVDYNRYLLNVNITTFDMPAYNEFVNHLRITKPVNLALNLILTHKFPKHTGYYAPVTVSGELVNMSPRIITNVEVGGNVHYGQVTMSGENVIMSPNVITFVGVSGKSHYGSTIITGELVILQPEIVTNVTVNGTKFNAPTMVDGESVVMSPRIITNVEVSGNLNKSLISVSGEEIKFYPRKEQTNE